MTQIWGVMRILNIEWNRDDKNINIADIANGYNGGDGLVNAG